MVERSAKVKGAGADDAIDLLVGFAEDANGVSCRLVVAFRGLLI